MLIRTRNSRDVVEFAVPRLSIRLLLWLGLFSPFLYAIGVQFHSVLGTKTTHTEMMLWREFDSKNDTVATERLKTAERRPTCL
jgi:hypothetical protein